MFEASGHLTFGAEGEQRRGAGGGELKNGAPAVPALRLFAVLGGRDAVVSFYKISLAETLYELTTERPTGQGATPTG